MRDLFIYCHGREFPFYELPEDEIHRIRSRWNSGGGLVTIEYDDNVYLFRISQIDAMVSKRRLPF